jgi:hypothetical protein
MLTNQITKKFIEPRLLILTDPRIDYNALKESSYVNIPIIALCNTDNNLQYVDCAIPCNNRAGRSLAMIYWLLTREVLYLRGVLKEGEQLNELVDMFQYRNVDSSAKVVIFFNNFRTKKEMLKKDKTMNTMNKEEMTMKKGMKISSELTKIKGINYK